LGPPTFFPARFFVKASFCFGPSPHGSVPSLGVLQWIFSFVWVFLEGCFSLLTRCFPRRYCVFGAEGFFELPREPPLSKAYPPLYVGTYSPFEDCCLFPFRHFFLFLNAFFTKKPAIFATPPPFPAFDKTAEPQPLRHPPPPRLSSPVVNKRSTS